jgi:hypothetical protein
MTFAGIKIGEHISHSDYYGIYRQYPSATFIWLEK